KGWADGKPLSSGYTSVEYFRNSPSLFNVANRRYLMWDGRLEGADLGTAVRDMLTEAHTMNMDSRLAQERLKQVPEYVRQFEAAFGPGDPYGGKIYGAIAEYLKTIRTTNAPFDRYLRGDAKALGTQQIEGLKLFAGKANCVQCHFGPTLSDGRLHVTGVADNPAVNAEVDRQVAMLRHFATMGVPNYMNLRRDVGHYVVSKETKDIGRFATPSLWDVGQTAPYMHSGVLKSLTEVIDFYDRGGGEAPNKSPLVKPLKLSTEEKAALVSFLGALTGDKPRVDTPKMPDYALREHGRN
ncbi:MAG: photosynthetic protein synthase I, partial [Rhodospirillales bacterium]|nr:photosynthetic protein synthase I [Rhodospirillales bacterium]